MNHQEIDVLCMDDTIIDAFRDLQNAANAYYNSLTPREMKELTK